MIRVPERDKKAGLCYAVTDDGVELPVVDVTHPAFAADIGLAELTALAERSARNLRRAARIPTFLARLAARRSAIVRGTMSARGTFLDAMTTYLYKLGPGNLGAGYASGMDRAMNGEFVPASVRLRHRDASQLIADALARALAAGGGRPAHLVNIGGGTASDSLNGLLLLRKGAPSAPAPGPFTIDVLELEAAGPSFGARALEALRANGAPLSGLDVLLRHVLYDWRRTGPLRRVLGRLRDDEALVCSSEGGLFEYGEDRDVVENLSALRDASPADARVIGSAVRPGPVLELVREVSRMPLRFRDPSGLEALAGEAGWEIERIAGGHLAYVVFSLRKSGRRAGEPR